MYYVYVLKSVVNSDIYVGSTKNIENRLNLHNSGKVKSTKGYKPWKLLEYHEYPTRSGAILAESFYKSHQQKELLKIRYDNK